MTAREVGEALGGISDETVNRWAREGKLPCITLPSGQRRYRRSDIDAILVPTAAGETTHPGGGAGTGPTGPAGPRPAPGPRPPVPPPTDHAASTGAAA